ncbi:MAG: hypothetical protein PHR43_00800 [Dehalococcoidales bacterium]|nr:hypothetical protein [Dehalococcoidales bacterium]
MGAIAAIIGAVGGLSAVMGILDAFQIVPQVSPQLTWAFWFQLAIILLLAAIALALGRHGSFD